mgnify:CR=1 FL=1
MKTVRWGILGTAQIAANVFIPALRTVHGAELAAVASRDKARAEAFATAHGAARAFGSYLELLDSGVVDALYVPLPNSEHARWTLEAAERGIPVFCEKPLTHESGSAARVAACDPLSRLRRRFMTIFACFTRTLVDRIVRIKVGR